MRRLETALFHAALAVVFVSLTDACTNPEDLIFSREYFVTIRNTGVGVGNVHWSVDGEVCGLSAVGTDYSCILKLRDAGAGGSFSLTAVPGLGFWFSGWGQSCAAFARSDPCVISFTAGSVADIPVSVKFEPPFEGPSTLSLLVVQGVPSTMNIRVPRAPGFTQRIPTSATGTTSTALPTGMTFSATQSSVQGATLDDWTLTVDASPLVALGKHSIWLNWVGPDVLSSVLCKVEVTVVASSPTGDFTINAPRAVSLGAGNIIGVTVTVARSAPIGDVSLSNVAGLPQGVTASWSPQTVPATATTSTLTIDATQAPLLAGAQATIQIDGVAPNLPTRSTTIDVTIAPATLTLTPVGSNVTVAPGGSQAVTIQLARSTAAIGAVALGGVANSGPITVTPAVIAASQTSGTITVQAPVGTPTGTYNVDIRGSGSGGIVGILNIAVRVDVAAHFTLTPTPRTLYVDQGSSEVISLAIQWTGTPTSVTLSTPSLPSGFTSTFVPSLTSGTSSQLVLSVAMTVAAGTYTVNVQGSAGALQVSTSIQVTVNPQGNFSLSVSRDAFYVLTLGAGSANVFINRAAGFTSSVAFSGLNLPLGIGTVFTPTASVGGGVSLVVRVAGYTAPGSYPITIRGAALAGTDVHTATILVVVGTYAPPTGFLLDVETPLTVSRSSATGTVGAIGILRAAGYIAPVSLALSGVPTGLSYTFSQSQVLGSTATVTFVAAPSMPLGFTSVVLTATSGSFVETKTISITIVAGTP
jgi:hypothetical protein